MSGSGGPAGEGIGARDVQVVAALYDLATDSVVELSASADTREPFGGTMTTHQDHPVNNYTELMVGNAQLVDVREPHEVAQGTLPDAVNIPLGDLANRLGELDADRRVVLLCRSGGRSTNAAQFLSRSGFGDVFNLAGGMLAFAAGG